MPHFIQSRKLFAWTIPPNKNHFAGLFRQIDFLKKGKTGNNSFPLGRLSFVFAYFYLGALALINASLRKGYDLCCIREQTPSFDWS